MQEVEKRLGLAKAASEQLKEKLNQRSEPTGSVPRTVLVKVEGADFEPDPDTPVDVKVKLIGQDNILSIKHGSWHGAAAREEYEINFRREDLANVIGGLSVLSYKRFILLSTLRTTWMAEDLMYTLDEYRELGQSLFEVEATGGASEGHVNKAFSDLGIAPMGSEETITFISGLNRHKNIQIDLTTVSASEVADRMLHEHSYAG